MSRELRTWPNDTALNARGRVKRARGVALKKHTNPQLTLIREAGLFKVFNVLFEPGQGLVLEIHTVDTKRIRDKLGQFQLWKRVGRVRK